MAAIAPAAGRLEAPISVPRRRRRLPILDRYIHRHVYWGVLIVLALLVAVFGFIEFVNELDETGKGYYGPTEAFRFVLKTLPLRALTLVPVTVLLGTLLGLSSLQATSELTAVRASGVSVARIGWAVLRAGVVFMVLTAAATEFLVPRLAQKAWQDRASAIAGEVAGRTEEGQTYWYRDGNRYINIRALRYGRLPTDIDIFEFDTQGTMYGYVHARDAIRGPGSGWTLRHVVRKRMDGQASAIEYLAQLQWDEFLSPSGGAAAELDAESLALTELREYVRDLRSRGQNAERYELALWRKLALPVTAFAMLLVAIPFVFGAFGLKSTSHRLAIGALVGIVFFLGDQILAQAGQLAGVSPALTAFIPSVAVTVFGLALFARVH
jgi:lipopolysaccharide export system permease protein